MSQEYPSSGSQGQQAEQYGGQQIGQQGPPQRYTPMGQQVGQQFLSSLPPEFRTALDSFSRVSETAEWCADKCIEHGPQLAECARACEDLADLAELNERMIARDSAFGPQIADAYLAVAQRAIPILQRHQQIPHVNETHSIVGQSLDSASQLLSSIGYQTRHAAGGSMQRSAQGMTPQFGSQQQGTQQPGTQQYGTQ